METSSTCVGCSNSGVTLPLVEAIDPSLRSNVPIPRTEWIRAEERMMETTNYLDRKGKLICGIDPAAAAQLVDALMAAHVSGEIDVVGPEEAHRLKHPPEECGLGCQINRFYLGFGNELDEFEWERERLQRGQAIVAVPAANPDVQARVRQIMSAHCQTSLHFQGTWTSKEL